MHLCISTNPSGSTALYFGFDLSFHPFERYRRFTSPSKRAADSQNFWPLSNTDAQVYVYRRAVFPALRWRSSEREKKVSNRLAASSFFQSIRHHRHWQSPISQLICQISQLIFDRSHVNSSHDVTACKVIDLRTMDRLCVRGPNDRVGGQRKRRMEDVRMLFGFHLDLWQFLLLKKISGSLGRNSRSFHSRSTLTSSMRSGFHSDECLTWLMLLCTSTDPSGSTAL